MEATLKSFIQGMQAVLPKLLLMSNTLEANGLVCNAQNRRRAPDNNALHRYYVWDQGKMRLYIMCKYDDSCSSVEIGISNNEGDAVALTAISAVGESAHWHVHLSSPNIGQSLNALKDDIKKLLPDTPSACVAADTHDDVVAAEIVKLMAEAFKRA
ncbi:MAG: hypothetical protein PHS79_02495 [Patescibacteria group bacterium]|nr:hypothetical protein [Patescibacteria group bacterium]